MNPTPSVDDVLALTSKGMLTRTVVARALEAATESNRVFLHHLLEAEVASRRRSKIGAPDVSVGVCARRSGPHAASCIGSELFEGNRTCGQEKRRA